MPFFQLRNVPKDTDKNSFNKAIRKCGKVKFCKLSSDQFNEQYLYGVANFFELHDAQTLQDYCNENKIKLIDKDNVLAKGTQRKKTFNSKDKRQQHTDKHAHKSIANPSFYFYKDKAYGKDIEKFSLKETYTELFSIPGTQNFSLSTTYPGLLVGSGYSHPKLPQDDNAFQLGFFFDHTTGLPLISGSSIKGLLRSLFPEDGKKYNDEKRQMLKDDYGIDEDLEDLKNRLFENGTTRFYDAYIEKTDNPKQAIFGSDYITSHFSDDPLGAFKNPNPIKFLKLLPEVTFKFQFDVEPRYRELFKQMILDFGLGAKTNVGYGQFKEG